MDIKAEWICKIIHQCHFTIIAKSPKEAHHCRDWILRRCLNTSETFCLFIGRLKIVGFDKSIWVLEVELESGIVRNE